MVTLSLIVKAPFTWVTFFAPTVRPSSIFSMLREHRLKLTSTNARTRLKCPSLFSNNYILNQEMNIFRNKDNEPLKCCSCKKILVFNSWSLYKRWLPFPLFWCHYMYFNCIHVTWNLRDVQCMCKIFFFAIIVILWIQSCRSLRINISVWKIKLSSTLILSSFSLNCQVKRMIGKLSYVYRKHLLKNFLTFA